MQFEEYSKLIYLDADIQVYDNIDQLFDLLCIRRWARNSETNFLRYSLTVYGKQPYNIVNAFDCRITKL